MDAQVAIFTTALLLGASGLSLPVQASNPVQDPVYLAQASTPVTYTTLVGNGDIVIQITDGNYRVHKYLDGINYTLHQP